MVHVPGNIGGQQEPVAGPSNVRIFFPLSLSHRLNYGLILQTHRGNEHAAVDDGEAGDQE